MIDILAISTASVTAINRNIYIELVSRGWKVEMVIPETYPLTAAKTIPAQPARVNDPVIHFLKLKGSNPRTFYFPGLKTLIDTIQPKVILIESDPVSYMAVHAGRLAVARGVFLWSLSCENLSFDVIDTLKRRGVRSLPTSLVKKCLYWFAKNSINTVFTINNDGTLLFQRKGYSHVEKIPLGFDPSVFYPNNESRERIQKQLNIRYPVIAYFGRLVEEKGVHLLVEALGKIKHLDWHFMLDKFSYESNPYHQRIQGLIDTYDLSARIIYIEADHYQVAAYMNASDVVVVPSVSTAKWKEQYGRVVPEAMACGNLVITSSAGALPELVEECGIVIEEANVDQLAQALENYVVAPFEYKEVRSKAIKRATHQLSIMKQADCYSARLQALLPETIHLK